MDAGRDDQIGDDSNKCSAELAQKCSQEVICLKVLVPSIAAGAIIGKGGEAIAQVQTDTGAKIKLSKLNDFYPGTSERVCLIQGTLDGVRAMHNYIIDRILEKPEVLLSSHSTQQVQSNVSSENTRYAAPTHVNPAEQHSGAILIPRIFPASWISPFGMSFVGQSSMNRILWERHKQVKILVPNCTAGLVIGKLGSYVNEIKDRTGAFIQISQKPKDINLIERCITIAGEPDQLRAAVDLVLAKIAEDPQSGTCPHISYSHIEGPVASAFPTGSPFAVGPPNIPAIGSNASRSFVADQAAAPGLNQRQNTVNNNQIIMQAAASNYQQQQQYHWEALKSMSCMAPAVIPVALPRSGMDPSSAAFLQSYAAPTSPGDPPSLEGFMFRTNPQSSELSPGFAYPISPDARPQSFLSLPPATANPFIIQSAMSSPTAEAFRDQSLVYDPAGQQYAYFPASVTYAGSVGDVTRVCGLYTGMEGSDSTSTSLGSMQYAGQASSIPSYPQSFYATAIPQLFPRSTTPPNNSVIQSSQRDSKNIQANVTVDYHCCTEAELYGVFPSNSSVQSNQQQHRDAAPMLAYLSEKLQAGEPIENLHNSLRMSGYPEEVILEITGALSTLSLHGILSVGPSGDKSQILPLPNVNADATQTPISTHTLPTSGG